MEQNNFVLCSEGVRRVGCEAIEGDHTKTLENKAFWCGLFADGHLQSTLTGCENSHLLTPSTLQEEGPESLETLGSHLSHLLTLNFEEIHYFFEERAAIYEYDGHKPRADAEHLALKEAVILYLEHQDPELLHALQVSLLGTVLTKL